MFTYVWLLIAEQYLIYFVRKNREEAYKYRFFSFKRWKFLRQSKKLALQTAIYRHGRTSGNYKNWSAK